MELGAKVTVVTEQSMLESPLHIAARCGRQDIVKRLLACNIPILSRTKVARTFLFAEQATSFLKEPRYGPMRCLQCTGK